MPTDDRPVQKTRSRQLLDEIVEHLNTGSSDARALWNVLSALRGPDGHAGMESGLQMQNVKRETTAKIRKAIGMNKNLYLDIADNENISHAHLQLATKVGNLGHFRYHIEMAVEAIKYLYPEK